MSANPSKGTDEKLLLKKIGDLEKAIQELRTNQNRVFVVPLLTADPGSLIDGQMWYRTDTDELKLRRNGTTRVVTTS